MKSELEIRAALSDLLALAATAWAEGRGDQKEGHSSVEERIAIMVVCRNRLVTPKKFRADAPTYKAVCLAPFQFSCWNAGTDANHTALLAILDRLTSGQTSNDLLFDETLYLARGVIANQLLDRTGGATLYYAPKAMVPAGRVPSWVLPGMTPIAIGDQLFFK